MDNKPKTSYTASQLQNLVGHKYSHIANERCVKTIARRHQRKTHIVGDKRFMTFDTLHGYHSLDTVIFETLEFVRNMNPTWVIQLIRFETISKKKKPVPPHNKAERNMKPKKDWEKRFITHEYMLIPDLKFTTYIAMDDSYKEYVDPAGGDMTNPCELFFRKPELENPLRADVMHQWIRNTLQGKKKQKIQAKAADEEEED